MSVFVQPSGWRGYRRHKRSQAKPKYFFSIGLIYAAYADITLIDYLLIYLLAELGAAGVG